MSAESDTSLIEFSTNVGNFTLKRQAIIAIHYSSQLHDFSANIFECTKSLSDHVEMSVTLQLLN